ncbi:MAG: histidine--tRNA ligase [Stappiaceae bacterium]
MAKKKSSKLKARLPRGFTDRGPAEISAAEKMLTIIRQTYELHGFEAVETPSFEYTDALGKFLPDQDRPNAGVFSLQDDDEQWMSLRYDLTAPLARYVAENFETLPKPYRSYRMGYVYRNEKPGPGRFRQFMQFDADTVGAPSVMADAEICMMASDTLERLGIKRGDYVIRVNNRKVLDGIMDVIGLGDETQAPTRLTVLRAVDKLDRLGVEGVAALLGAGRKDESGDFTKGAGLDEAASQTVLAFVAAGAGTTDQTIENLRSLVKDSETGTKGVDELAEIGGIVQAAGYDDGRILIDPSVVRGLEYYTGPVYEAELTFETTDKDGQQVRFGSVAGGGRYDGLVGRFKGQDIPSTGFSMGVSRLMAALQSLGKLDLSSPAGPVVVCVMDRDRESLARYSGFARQLREADIAAEVFQGNPKQFGKQLQYADRRNSPCVIIQGSDERAAGELQVKDLIEGKRLSEEIEDNATWRESRPAQVTVPEDRLVETVREILARQEAGE